MTSPKPQQFEGQSDASDDLIAELARMMAGDAQESERPAAAPAAADPVRPASGPAVRIPGGDNAQPENAPRSRPSFDFGRAPVAAPVIVPKSLSEWQAPSSPVAPRQESRSEPASFAQPAPAEPVVTAPTSSYRAPEPEPVAEQHSEPPMFESHDSAWGEDTQPQAASDDSHDAIADLIAAELENVQFDDEPAFETQPATVSVEATEVVPVAAHVEPEPVIIQPAPQQPEPRFEPTPAPTTITPPPSQPAAHSAFLRAVDLKGRETQADNFAVSPVFGLGGRPQQANAPAAPAASTSFSQSAATERATPQPAPSSEPAFGASMFAPRTASPGEPAFPRHQPIAPAMSAIAPNAKLDPLEEIESLIGDAVRVELDAPAGRSEPNFGTPEVRATAAPVAPQRTSIPLASLEPRFGATTEPTAAREMTAEDAILAAAAASGAEVNRIDMRGEVVEDRRAEKLNRKQKRAAEKAASAAAAEPVTSSGNFRRYVGPAVAGTLLLAAGFGLYWVLGMGGQTAPNGAAPVLTAEAGAVKETPAEPAPSTETPSGSVVFNEMSRSSSTDQPGAEQLVSRDQTDGQDVARVITPEAEATANGNADSGLANRKVRTVTVRPDGTIVSGEADALAGSEQLPVARPNVPAVPGATTQDASDLLEGAQAMQAQTVPPAVTPPASAAQPQLGTPDSSAPIPAPRPAFRGNSAAMLAPAAQAQVVTASAAPATAPTDLMGGSQQQAAPVQVASAAPAPVSAGNAAAYVQLSSQRSQPEAQAALDNIQRRFGGLFAGTSLEIRQADLGERGTFYRVLLPASSLQSAGEICANVKAGGGDCFIPGN